MLKRIFKETATYAIAGVISRVIGILLIPIYTRMLSPSEFGLYDILLTILGILVLLSGLQVESGIGRSYYEARQKKYHPDLVGTGIILCFVGALVCWLIMLIAYLFIHKRWMQNQGAFLLVVAFSALPSQLLNLAQMVLRLENRVNQFLILSIGDILTTSCLCVGIVVYGHFGVAGIIGSMLASKLIWILVSAVWLKPFYNFRFNRIYAKEILVYSLPTLPGGLVAWCQSSASRYILAGAMSLFEVGIFGLAVRIGSPVVMLLTAFRMAWYPFSMEIMGHAEFKEKCARMLDIYWLLGFPICAMIAAFGGLAIALLASKSYLPAGGLVGFIVMGILWMGAQQIVGLGNDYVRKTYLTLIAFAAGTGINIVILMATIKRWGLVSAALAYLAGNVGTTIVLMALAQKQIRMPYRYPVMLWVGIGSVVVSFWCLWGPPPQAGLSDVLLDALKKGAVALAMSAIVVIIAASKDDKVNARRALVSAYQGMWA